MQERKLTVGGVIATIILGCLIIALMIYTATRTIHFLQMTFPPSMGYVAYLALAAFDGGIIGWTIFATFGSEGPAQRGVAYLMIFICAVGVILTTVADTLLVSQSNGLTKAPPDIATIGLWGSIAIIVLNVLAGITVHLASPHHIRKWQMETMRDDVYRAAMKHTKTKVSEQIPHLAQGMANFEIQRLAQELVGHLPPAASSQSRQLPAPARVVESTPITQAASRTHTVDPHNVKAEVKESKLTEKKPLWERIKGVVDFSIPVEETPQNETVVIEEQPVEEETIETEELPENYLDWTDKQWKQAKEQLTKDQYDELFDEAFPPDGLKPTPKTKKKVSRRKVLGMEKQED